MLLFNRYLHQHGSDAEEGGVEGVDVGLGGVAGEGGADGAGDAVAVHDGLGAVVAGADGYSQTVEQRADVQMVDVAHVERDDGILRR